MKASAFPFASLLLLSAMATAGAVTRPPSVDASVMVPESAAKVIKITTGKDQAVNQHLTLGLNKAAIIELDADAKDVMVSSPDIADAVVKTPRRIFLLGTKTGQTNAF